MTSQPLPLKLPHPFFVANQDYDFRNPRTEFGLATDFQRKQSSGTIFSRPLQWLLGVTAPLCQRSYGLSCSDSPYQIYPGYPFSSQFDNFKILQGSSPSSAVRAASEMTKKTNRTMYLLFLERSGHLETVASVSSTKFASYPTIHLLPPFTIRNIFHRSLDNSLVFGI